MDKSLFRFVWKNSRREQIVILLLILASLPFYWISLEIPKRIVNEALQGRAFHGGQQTIPLSAAIAWLPEWLTGPITLDRLQFLFVLSGFYLTLVLVNGWFKYQINLSKGILGERMLRRLRYELVALFLRFRPEAARSAKPAEIASMVKDEVEPIGGFIGDAFIQPAFLGTQALTALIFIIAQSTWLGLVALTVVLIQTAIIPLLRREQIRLGRERQIASRKLAGRIGEIVDGAPAILTHGTMRFNEADVGTRLGGLFDIRTRLFKRKFAVKFLNNLLSQITPFLFFAVGGYFALKGRLDIGQLVAVVAAYRDLPPPIKELIDWEQQRNDVTVKYEQIVSQFSPEAPNELVRDLPGDAARAPIKVEGLQVADRLGTPLFEPFTTTIERPSHLALVGSAAQARSAFAKALGRQISEYRGAIRIGERPLTDMHPETASKLITFASAEPSLFHGSIHQNILFSLMRRAPDHTLKTATTKEERRLYEEALLSGNLVLGPRDDWIDYEAAGVGGAPELDLRLLEVLQSVGLRDDVFMLGLLGRIGQDAELDVKERLLAARRAMTKLLRSDDLQRYVEPFDPDRYNANASLGENLLFGAPINDQFSETRLASDPRFQKLLADEGLVEPVLDMGRKIAETTIEMFDGVSAGDPLFERYSFIRAEDMAIYKAIVANLQAAGSRPALTAADQAKLITLTLGYIEPRHRFRLLDDNTRRRVIAVRRKVRSLHPADIEFYDPDQLMASGSIRDNLLFGRLAFALPDAEQKLAQPMRDVIGANGLETTVYRVGLSYDIGPQGKELDQKQRVAIDLARCLIRRPKVLIIDGALSVFDDTQARSILAEIRREMQSETLIANVSDKTHAEGFTQLLTFEGRRVQEGAK